MKKLTRKQVWENGLHLEWVERGTWMQFGGDIDMFPEIVEAERIISNLLGGKWRISLAVKGE